MSTALPPTVRPFSEGEPYTQPEPPGASFRYLLKQDEVPGLCMLLLHGAFPCDRAGVTLSRIRLCDSSTAVVVYNVMEKRDTDEKNRTRTGAEVRL